MSNETTTIYDRKTEIPLLTFPEDRRLDVYERFRFKDREADSHRAETGWTGPVAVDFVER